MKERIKKIMSDIFQVNLKDINENSSPDNIIQWDSIGHLNLITSIEEEFGIVIDEDQMLQMVNFKLIILIIKECKDFLN